MQVPREVAPVRVLARVIVRQRCLIGACGIAHPGENPPITNHHRVRAHTRTFGGTCSTPGISTQRPEIGSKRRP